MAINSKTELMKGEINQTQINETCSFEPPAQAAHHQPSRVNIWVTISAAVGEHREKEWKTAFCQSSLGLALILR